ncbi:Oligopeptide transporter [Macleaya cordata]|uniref:Oligopeptide transporter n=1 Tax=Macleaya cordata TaxID=56857 RepID=A0A200QNR0_MACCD|nr:Oligopeptide transporter [Macleaya cordata]
MTGFEAMEIEEREEGRKAGEEELTIEQIFESKEVPSWGQQLTIRSVVVSALLGFLFTFIVMKLNVSTGIIPSLNVAAGLLGFFFVKSWTTVLSKFGISSRPFTRQENTVIQTCVVASSGIAFSSGYASYILGMTSKVADQGEALGNTGNNVKELHFLWMLIFVSVVSFVGLFSIVPLRKIMILDYKLTYPSGTATAYLINSFHTPKGAKLAKKQVAKLFKWFSISFVWAFFQWFFTASDNCGFTAFPTFGLQAFKYRFYFDFSSTYVGVGMICPYLINLSMLLGSVISWGVMWPLIEQKKGIWYGADLSSNSLRGLQGYKVFIAIAMILGDGLFHFVVVLVKTIFNICRTFKSKNSKKEIIPVTGDASSRNTTENFMSYDDQRRTQFFLKDQIPMKVAAIGYLVLAILAIIAVPIIFHQLKWYHIVVIYTIAPILAFCNSYGCGLTDWSLASSYGKLAIFVFGAWVGLNNGGVVAGLAACGVMMSIVSTASDLMQDFKTGYLTLASPRSMFFSQIIGTALGCVLSPFVFWFFFYKAFPTLGQSDSAYPAPFGLLYRGIALISIEGTSALPKNCLTLSISFFLLAIVLNLIREVLMHYKIQAYKYVPSAMAMAIPFYLGGYFTIDMCVGSLIKFLWEKKNKAEADAFVPAMASGMICGDSLWGMPTAILSLANVKPPLCMKFLSRAANAKVDGFLQG